MPAFKEESGRKDYCYIGIERPAAKRFKKIKPESMSNTDFMRLLLKTWRKAGKPGMLEE